MVPSNHSICNKKIYQLFMKPNQKITTRKKFLLWGGVLVASITAWKWLPGGRSVKSNTVKMLSQDGTLVEIDKSLLASSGKKISNKELQKWVRKPKTTKP